MFSSGALSRWGALGLAGLIAAAVPAYALAVSALPSLAKLERGRWLLRNLDARGERSVCLGDPAALVQVEHRGSCSHEIVASDASGGTVQYTCPGRGFGRTQIRIETARLASIETQGLSDGRPFAYRVEAKKIGAC